VGEFLLRFRAEVAQEIRFEDAAYAYTIGNFDEAFTGFSGLVQEHYAPAATYLAQMYLRGEAVSKDVRKGIDLLQLAAAWGHELGAFNLGALHRSGAWGVPIDREKSRHNFLLAKQLGCKLPVEDYLW
jgi:TPR repeat protein